MLLEAGERLVVPDFAFVHEDGTEVALEIVGYWTPEYLAEKFQKLARISGAKLIVAVRRQWALKVGTPPPGALPFNTRILLRDLMSRLEALREHAAGPWEFAFSGFSIRKFGNRAKSWSLARGAALCSVAGAASWSVHHLRGADILFRPLGVMLCEAAGRSCVTRAPIEAPSSNEPRCEGSENGPSDRLMQVYRSIVYLSWYTVVVDNKSPVGL
jgi:hypothetical protein